MTWRTPDHEDRQVAVLWAVCAALVVGLRGFWLAGSPLLPPCPFHVLTGWPCPTCGTSRAMLRLLHADVRGALGFNPLAASGAIAFVSLGLSAPLWLFSGGKVPRLSPRPKPIHAAAAAAAFVMNWAWLIARGL